MKRLACLLVVVLAAGCSSTTTESPTASSVPTTQPQEGVKGTVNLKQYPLAPPEIPVQQHARVDEGQAVKGPNGEDVFYGDGEEITVYCITLGEPYPSMTEPTKDDVEWYMVEAAEFGPGYLQVQFVDVTQPVRHCDTQPIA